MMTKVPLQDSFRNAAKMIETFHVILAMKSVRSNFVRNISKSDVAGLNIDGARIGSQQTVTTLTDLFEAHGNKFGFPGISRPVIGKKHNPPGRWPANVIHDGGNNVLKEFAKSGIRVSQGRKAGQTWVRHANLIYSEKSAAGSIVSRDYVADTGTADRYFKKCEM